MSLLTTIVSPINDIVDSLGPNDLPYAIPVHPNLVHLPSACSRSELPLISPGPSTPWRSGCSAYWPCR